MKTKRSQGRALESDRNPFLGAQESVASPVSVSQHWNPAACPLYGVLSPDWVKWERDTRDKMILLTRGTRGPMLLSRHSIYVMAMGIKSYFCLFWQINIVYSIFTYWLVNNAPKVCNCVLFFNDRTPLPLNSSESEFLNRFRLLFLYEGFWATWCFKVFQKNTFNVKLTLREYEYKMDWNRLRNVNVIVIFILKKPAALLFTCICVKYGVFKAELKWLGFNPQYTLFGQKLACHDWITSSPRQCITISSRVFHNKETCLVWRLT